MWTACLPDKRANVSLVGSLEELVVLEPVLLPDDDRRVARLHQDEVHEQPAGPPVAVDERVDVDELVVCEGGEPDRVEVAVLRRVEPVDELVHEELNVRRVRRYVISHVDLRAPDHTGLQNSSRHLTTR